MYHSITFDFGEKNKKNTWDDWHLVPTSRPVFNPPAQKVKTIDIPGGDGVIDLSQALTGYPVFQNRAGSFEFIVPNGFEPWEAGKIEQTPWHSVYSEIMDLIHGQSLRAILEDDPEYFYEGRFTVNSWKSQKDWSRITIDYSVAPINGRCCHRLTIDFGILSLSKWSYSGCDLRHLSTTALLPSLMQTLGRTRMPSISW